MAARVRACDWSLTPLGLMEHWPDELRVAVNICLDSRFPMFVWWGPDLINIYNDAYVPMLGHRHPAALGRPARDAWHDIWSVVGPQAEAVLSRGEATWNDRVKLVMERNGYREDTYFTWSYSPIRDKSGRIGGMFCAVTEETERVRSEADRDRLAAQRQLALDAARLGWWHYDPATTVATFDRRYGEIFDLTGPQRPNEDALKRIHPDDLPGVLAKVEAALDPAAPEAYSAEYRIILDDGAVRWVEARGSATFDGEGAARRATSFVGTVADVTERKLAEEQPRRILESITDAFFALDPGWRFTYVNPQAERVLGRAPGDLLGRTLWDEYPGIHGSEFERAYRRAADERVATSITSFYPDHDRWYEVHAYPAPGGGISVYFRDVTERQQWLTTLAETRRKLDSALIAGEVGTFEWDVTNDRLWGDRNFEHIFGIKLDASGAAPLATYVAAIHPADRHRVLEQVNRSVETGCDYEAEYRVTSTVPPRWVTARGKVERDDNGRVIRFPGVVLDETERKEAELLLSAQNRALGLVATGAPVAEALGVLTQAVEDQYDGNAVAAILLVDGDGCTLRTGAAPSLPPEYCAAIDGIRAKPGLGTCADAAARNEFVITADIDAAPSWRGLSHLPLALGLKAAWSMPIRASDGRVLGTFGTYFRECREPSARERQIVESLCVAAAMAVERRRADEALRASEGRLRFLSDLAEQTRDLTDPERVMATVARTLGEHLRVSRCAYAEVEADSDGFTIRHDYTNGCPSSVGTYRLDRFGPRAAADQRSGRTLVVHDVDAELAPAEGGDTFNAIGIKAIVCCPLVRQGRLMAMMAVHQAAPRRWTADEVALVEVVVERSWAYIERARAVRAVAESEARFRQLADAMPQMVWVARQDGHHEYYNHRWYEFTGVPTGSTDGEGWNGMFHPEDQERAWAVWRQSLATGEPYEIEYRLRHRSGEYRWTLGRALPIRDASGAITKWFGTCTDIDAIKRWQREREHLLDGEQAARAEAERASRMKDEFLATLSHELRTPLNAILGWATILQGDGAAGEDDLREGLEAIERNARAQTQIIEDLLDMSRIISGKVRLDVQQVDLAAVVRGAVETVKHAADAKAIRVQTVLDPLDGPVFGDPGRLQQVFWNLLTNAIKFTPKGGRVQVLLERVNSHVEVRVTDSGEGIRPEFLPHVFDRFKQADASTTRRHGGLGLGLGIVKQLVELHGGTVTAKSAGVGRGSTFVVVLPVTPVQPDPREESERRPPESSHAAAPLNADLCKQIAGLKVLVVDDEADSRAVVQRLLEACAAIVVASGSAADALERVRAERPDVLVSDIGMPDEDGYSLIRRVRALGPERGGNVPAVALTAYARSEDRTRSILAGFQMHIAKPVEPSELIAMVASLAGRTR